LIRQASLRRVLPRRPQPCRIAVSLAALLLLVLPLASQTPAKPLSVEAIYAHGPLIGTLPEDLSWSPDGKHLTYMTDGMLMELDQATGRARVLVGDSKLEKLTAGPDTEQDRDHRERYKMPSYQWAPDSQHLLFDRVGRLSLYDLKSGKGEQIGDAGMASGDDPEFSPDGASLSFIRNHSLAVARLKEPGLPVTVVAAAESPAILNGEVDWIYLEELDARGNTAWSPDSKQLAYLQMDESAVPEYPITDWLPTHAKVEMQRYPQPGDANPSVRVGVVNVDGGKTVWMQTPIRAGQDYIPRFGWVDAKTLWIETLTRDQKHRDLYFADAATGQAHAVLQLTDEKFFDDNYDLFVGDGYVVLTNWSDGHNHVYLYSYDAADPSHAKARLERQLTQGDFEVADVLRVDTAGKLVDYTSNESSILEQQIWQVSFSGERKQLSAGAGHHDYNFAPAGGTFIDKQSSRMEPPTLKLCAEAEKCIVFWKAWTLEPYHLRAPEQMEVKAKDGTLLYATLLLPEDANDAASVPVIVNPYGGPGSEDVLNRWSNDLLFDELLAQHGFAVLHTDNRGMAGRGRAFAQAAYRDFGGVQLQDQLTVLDAALKQHPQLDAKRLGWWGWSWGGSFTLYAMSHTDRFRAGVAVAPVTDWLNYDSIYTERYLGLPRESGSRYGEFSLLGSAFRLKGRLLLAHGTGDDNVHLENTVQYVQKLIEAGKSYDLQIYPRKTHSISGADVRTQLYGRILAHFEEYLKPSAQ